MFMFKFTKQHALGKVIETYLHLLDHAQVFFWCMVSLMFGSLIGSFIGLSMYSLGKPLKIINSLLVSFLVLGTVIYFFVRKNNCFFFKLAYCNTFIVPYLKDKV